MRRSAKGHQIPHIVAHLATREENVAPRCHQLALRDQPVVQLRLAGEARIQVQRDGVPLAPGCGAIEAGEGIALVQQRQHHAAMHDGRAVGMLRPGCADQPRQPLLPMQHLDAEQAVKGGERLGEDVVGQGVHEPDHARGFTRWKAPAARPRFRRSLASGRRAPPCARPRPRPAARCRADAPRSRRGSPRNIAPPPPRCP